MATSVPKEKYRYKNESFDRLLQHTITTLTEEQKSRLPDDLVYKIYRTKNPSVNSLTDAQKDYIINAALVKPIIKVIPANEGGATIEEYLNLMKVWRKKSKADVNAFLLADNMAFQGEFVMADKDLYDALQYKAMVCYSPVFRMALNARKMGAKHSKGSRNLELGLRNVLNMFVHYETNKKRLVQELSLVSMSEWYCLIYFYEGEKRASSVYKEKFKYAFSCSEQALKKALTRLKNIGLLQGRGSKRNHVVSTTAKGKALVDKMMVKYILNY